MERRFLIWCILASFFAANASADVIIKRYDGPLPSRSPAPMADLDRADSTSGLSAVGVAEPAEKVNRPTVFYILPLLKIDSTDAGGETTFVSIRNEHTVTQEVTLQLFDPQSAADALERRNALLPKETWVLNLRGLVTGPVDADGFIRGWGRLLGDGPISADFFQFNPNQDFATGGIPIDISAGGFCEKVKIRFLVGGTFDGGTLITFMLDSPLGNQPGDPPSITGVVYQEDSTPAGSFEIFTDRFTLEVNAEDLLSPGANFGSIDVEFKNGFQGGAAFVEYKANDRFSVGLKSVCLDTP